MKSSQQLQDRENLIRNMQPPPKKFKYKMTTRRVFYKPYVKAKNVSGHSNKWTHFRGIFSSYMPLWCKRTLQSISSRASKYALRSKENDAKTDIDLKKQDSLVKEADMPRLNNVDHEKLNQQINKFKQNDVQKTTEAQQNNVAGNSDIPPSENTNPNDKSKVHMGKNVSEGYSWHKNDVPELRENTSNLSSDKGLVSSNENSKHARMNRKRKASEISQPNDKISPISKDLKNTAKNHTYKRKKTEDIIDNEELITMPNTKKSKQSKLDFEEQSDSESSECSVTSQERDILVAKYFTKIFEPLLEEQRK